MSQVPPDSPPPPPSFPPPSSPPPNLPPGGSSVPFSPGAAVGYGWSGFWKNVGPMLGLTVAIFIVEAVVGAIGQATGNAVVSIIFSIIGFIVGLVLAMGLTRAALAVTKGEKPEFAMLMNTDRIAPYAVAAILFGIGFYIGLILCIIPGIIFALMFMFHGFVVIDSPQEISGTDALKASNELTKGHKGELFLLVLILIGINIVGAILCFVGLLFTYGISAIAVAYAYRTLRGEPVAQLS